jgi:6-phospho-beta-glucosidase
MAIDGVKIAVIGGGSSYTPELIEGFIQRYSELPVKEIYLVDVESGKGKLEIIGNLAKRMVEKAGLNIRIELTLDREEGIRDADFVITQFRVGGLDARIRDEKIPLLYDVIGQETTGPGGFAKAQRTIPVMMDICRDMERLAPNSWLINFTNPAGIVTEAILKYTNVKVIGLCNVPIGMVSGAAEILGVEMKQVYIDFLGLNHLVWGSKIFLEGLDITETFISGLQKGKSISMKNIQDLEWDQDLLRSLGMFPCPYHRYYYMPDEMLKREKEEVASSGTRGERVKAAEKELFALYNDTALNIKPPQLEQRGGAHYSDAACSLVNSIYNDKKDIQVVNVRNNGTTKDLPDDVVIERNCIIDKNGAHPINIGHVPITIKGLMQIVKNYEELTIEAAVKGDTDLAIQALLAHPLVPSIGVAKSLWNDILEQNKVFLPQFQ